MTSPFTAHIKKKETEGALSLRNVCMSLVCWHRNVSPVALCRQYTTSLSFPLLLYSLECRLVIDGVCTKSGYDDLHPAAEISMVATRQTTFSKIYSNGHEF